MERESAVESREEPHVGHCHPPLDHQTAETGSRHPTPCDTRVCVCVCVWMLQVWVCWVGRYRERAALREGMAVAEQHWVARWEAACWAAWTAYVVQRRKKRHMNGNPLNTRTELVFFCCVCFRAGSGEVDEVCVAELVQPLVAGTGEGQRAG